MGEAYAGSMELTNGRYVDLTQGVQTLIKQRLTDIELMEAEASKAEAEEAEASKTVAEASKEEASKGEAHLETNIINTTITISTNTVMVLPQQLTQISRAMQHPAIQQDLHRVDLGMEIITITIDLRPGMLNASAMFPIGPPDSCIH